MPNSKNLIDVVMEPADKATNDIDRITRTVASGLLLPFVALPAALQALTGTPPTGNPESRKANYNHAHVAFKGK